MTAYSDKTNQNDNTNINQDTHVEDWMIEIWDWIDNHNITPVRDKGSKKR